MTDRNECSSFQSKLHDALGKHSNIRRPDCHDLQSQSDLWTGRAGAGVLSVIRAAVPGNRKISEALTDGVPSRWRSGVSEDLSGPTRS